VRRKIETLSDLAAIDHGKIDKAFRLNLLEVLGDLAERPALTKDRKITLTVNVQPRCDEHGQLTDVVLDCEVGRSVPKEQSRGFSMELLADKGRVSGLGYNDLAPEDHRQGTLDDVPEKGEVQE